MAWSSAGANTFAVSSPCAVSAVLRYQTSVPKTICGVFHPNLDAPAVAIV
jgi:hypothetical protein